MLRELQGSADLLLLQAFFIEYLHVARTSIPEERLAPRTGAYAASRRGCPIRRGSAPGLRTCTGGQRPLKKQHAAGALMLVFPREAEWFAVVFAAALLTARRVTSSFSVTFQDILGNTSRCHFFASVFPERSYGRHCGDSNVLPHIHWTDGPPDTQSYMLIMQNLNSSALHLAAWNIPATSHSVSADTKWGAIGASLGLTTSGSRGYSGPCPQDDFECVAITVLALKDARLAGLLETDGTASFISSYLASLGKEGKVLARAVIYSVTVLHERHPVSTS